MQNLSFPSLDAHYAAALNLTVPWIVTSVDLDVDGSTLAIAVEHSGRTAPCPTCDQTLSHRG